MKGNPLRLAEGRILVEQLRLSMGNLGSTVIPTFLLVVLIFWVLSNDANAPGMRLWCAATILSKLNCWRHARHHLVGGIALVEAPRLVWVLIVLNAVDGAIWGSLTWAALDNATLAGSVLVIAVLTAVAANSMSLLSPVLSVFVALTVAEMSVGVSKLFFLGDPAYSALGIAGVLYFHSVWPGPQQRPCSSLVD